MEKPNLLHTKAAEAYSRVLRAPADKQETSAPLEDRPGEEPVLLKTNTPIESKFRRLAKFLILIGEDEASRILAGLDREQVEKVTGEIAGIESVSPQERDEIYLEFCSLLLTGAKVRGGVDEARRILYQAYGAERGEAILRKAAPGAFKPFGFLEEFTGEQAALLLREESPSLTAMVLSRVSPKLAAQALAAIRGEKKVEILRRIANVQEVSPQVLEQTAAALREKARALSRVDESAAVDGRSALTAILKNADISFGEELLKSLAEKDPELGRDIKERLFTFDDVLNSEDKPIEEKLRAMSDKEIALLLRKRSPEFTEKILSNLSSARRASVREEDALLGPVPKKDADAAAKAFLAWYREGRETGKIAALDGDEYI
jgi:flagellar motor switch protein FliG